MAFYVLSWYSDGSGRPQLRFFDPDNGSVDLAREGAEYASVEAAAGKLVVVRTVGADVLSEGGKA